MPLAKHGAKIRKILERKRTDAEKVTSARKILQEKGLNAIAALVVRLAQTATTDERSAVVVAVVETDEVGAVYAAVVLGDLTFSPLLFAVSEMFCNFAANFSKTVIK